MELENTPGVELCGIGEHTRSRVVWNWRTHQASSCMELENTPGDEFVWDWITHQESSCVELENTSGDEFSRGH